MTGNGVLYTCGLATLAQGPYQTRSDVAKLSSPDKEAWPESSARGAIGKGNKALSEPASGPGFALLQAVQW
jgi:hypothetical protein